MRKSCSDNRGHLNISIAATGALKAAGELLERHRLSPRPHKRLHIEIGTSVAVNGNMATRSWRLLGGGQVTKHRTRTLQPSRQAWARVVTDMIEKNKTRPLSQGI
jgi:hypothetical protein